MIFTHLEASTNCQNKKNCYEGSVSSKCVSLPETKACLDFVDEEEKNQHRHTLQWHKHTQNFYYSWENKRQVLRASVISNAKRLKIEGKRKVSNLIKDSDKGSGGWWKMLTTKYLKLHLLPLFYHWILSFFNSIFAKKFFRAVFFKILLPEKA